MSKEINELASALSKAQAQLNHAKKGSVNPFFKSKYADLTSIIEALKTPFAENNLSYTQLAESENGSVKITTILMHSSGQWIKGVLPLKPVKEDPQAYGSAITYGRRYGLQSIAGISSDEDDDGNAASAPQKDKAKSSQSPKKETAKRRLYNALSDQKLNDVQIKDFINFMQSVFGVQKLSENDMREIIDKLDSNINEWKDALRQIG
jgi:hypothetical protein